MAGGGGDGGGRRSMSKPDTILGDLPYLYAEELQGKRVPLTIKGVRRNAEFFNKGRKTVGVALLFAETDKALGVTSVTVRRQLVAATGTIYLEQMVGKKVVLYPEPSDKSPSGWAIRVAPPEGA